LNHLNCFSRFLARHGLHRGLYDHKESITQSSGREKQAFATILRVGQITPSASLQNLPDTSIAQKLLVAFRA
jgi:hypothetical protein